MLRLRHFAVSLPLFAAFALFLFSPQPAQAKYIGADSPACEKKCLNCGGPPCQTCQKRCKQRLVATPNSFVSETEGTNAETYSGPVVKSAFGPTLMLDLTYNSYDADGSRASINTVLGYGWTHAYNEFLFSQRGSIFRFQGDGRIVEYSFVGNGTYQTSTGYFETLKQNSNGCSYNLTDNYQTQYCFQSIPGTPFMVNGPVWRLTKITDRNNNVTTLTYIGGNLTSITDTYGRSLTFTYNAKNLISTVTDPLGRVTTFTYNAGVMHLLTMITDPTGAVTKYSYNYLYQITSKI